MFSFHWISILLISITFPTYLANIIFSCDMAFDMHRFNLWSYLKTSDARNSLTK